MIDTDTALAFGSEGVDVGTPTTRNAHDLETILRHYGVERAETIRQRVQWELNK